MFPPPYACVLLDIKLERYLPLYITHISFWILLIISFKPNISAYDGVDTSRIAVNSYDEINIGKFSSYFTQPKWIKKFNLKFCIHFQFITKCVDRRMETDFMWVLIRFLHLYPAIHSFGTGIGIVLSIITRMSMRTKLKNSKELSFFFFDGNHPKRLVPSFVLKYLVWFILLYVSVTSIY